MPRNSSGDRFIEHALRQMHNDGFDVDLDVEFDDVDFNAVATLSDSNYWEGGIGPAVVVFVFSEFDRLNRAKMRRFVDDAYDFAAQMHADCVEESQRFPFYCHLWVLPVAVAAEATDGVVRDFAEELPSFPYSGPMGYPIIYDANSDESYCFNDARRLGLLGQLRDRAWTYRLVDVAD